MFSVAALLERAKARANIDSDYRLAKVIGKSHQVISGYRAGKSLPDESVIEQLCILSGDDPDVIAAQIQAARSKTPEAKNMWLRVAARMAGRAKVDILPILIAICLIAASALPARASEAFTAKAYDLAGYTSSKVDNSPMLSAYHKVLERLRRFKALLRLSICFI